MLCMYVPARRSPCFFVIEPASENAALRASCSIAFARARFLLSDPASNVQSYVGNTNLYAYTYILGRSIEMPNTCPNQSQTMPNTCSSYLLLPTISLYFLAVSPLLDMKAFQGLLPPSYLPYPTTSLDYLSPPFLQAHLYKSRISARNDF